MSAPTRTNGIEGLEIEGSQRIDRWLWAARFFKTRSRARDAVRSGKVGVNGARAKPARQVRPGDRVDVRTPGGRFVVDVDGINEQRRPAPQARHLYTETAESQAARDRERQRERERRAAVVFDEGRPDRRERRASIRWRKRQGGP